MTSLGVAIAVALVALIVWNVWGLQEKPLPYQRLLSEISLDWRCESGHHFRAPGQVGPRLCPQCRKEASPCDMYNCREHGDFEVLWNFGDPTDGLRPKPQLIQYQGRSWDTFHPPVKCPICGKKAFRLADDPLFTRQSDSNSD